jgi:hypothetical protein
MKGVMEMKKQFILVGAVALTLLTAGSAMAAPRSGNGTCDGTGLGIGNDGVRQYINCDVNGDGICDGTGAGGFVDANGDGICDVGSGTQPQDGTGIQYRGHK